MSNLQLVCPLLKCHCLTKSCKQSVVLFVVCLLNLVGPSAVIWLIVSGWINPVKRHAFWLLAHVGKKILKADPPFTHLHASRPIVYVTRIFRVVAAGLHSGPSVVSLRNLAISCVAMCFRPQANLIGATARPAYSLDEVSRNNIAHGSAIAATRPENFTSCALPVRSANNGPLTNFDAGEVFKFPHTSSLLTLLQIHYIGGKHAV